MIMTRLGKLLTSTAAFAIVSLTCGSAMASNFSGELPVGYSASVFQISGASALAIDINALGIRDPAICASCNSSYTDTYTVDLFNQSGKLLESLNETNYLYYNMYSGSNGLGAGAVWLTVPAGATTLEIVSRLSVAGLLGPNGSPLSFGYLNISTDGSLTAATPIPSTLPLLATGLATLGLFGWRRKRKGAVVSPVEIGMTARAISPRQAA